MYNLANNFSHFDIEGTISKKFESFCLGFSMVYSPSNQFYYIISSCKLDESEKQDNIPTFPRITNALTLSETDLPSDNPTQISSFSSDTLLSSSLDAIYNLSSTNFFISDILIETNLNTNIRIKDIETESLNISDYIDKIISQIKKDELLEKIPEIINLIKIGEIYESKGENFTLSIKPIDASYQQNTTHINFKQCEEILRNTLNISSERIITFLLLEVYDKKEKSLVNQVEYQVYDDNKTLLDLSLCNDSNIKIFYALKENYLNMSIISFFKKYGIDIFNIKDSFFTDICRPFTYFKNDIILKDRIKEIFQNFSVCNEGCLYDKIDLGNKTIQCDCEVKYNLSINESSLNLITQIT